MQLLFVFTADFKTHPNLWLVEEIPLEAVDTLLKAFLLTQPSVEIWPDIGKQWWVAPRVPALHLIFVTIILI